MIEDFYELEPYELNKEEKSRLLTTELIELTRLHQEKCPEYARYLRAISYDESKVSSPEDIPFFPVRTFKDVDLLSIPREEVFKTMTSSGTTGQRVSKIYVDKETAMIQQKVLVKILSDYWGKKRLPMLVIDSKETVRNRQQFTARGAAIMGLQIVARDIVYALNDDMSLNVDAVKAFLEKYSGQRFIIFGFTFIVWQHLYQAIQGLKADKKSAESKDDEFDISSYDLSEAFLMTGGGWKKLVSESISQNEFKNRMTDVLGITHFLDHYAMVEQTGCIYAECECGHLHASNYSDVFIRDANDFSVKEIGEKGIIQTVSVLPHSYPGHSLLTEDEGIILGEDDCPCGRKGKYIQILGRLKSAELRGCSDTYADKLQRSL
ncbi:Phenylacetate-coenzyme A ligase PaaK, adenylate-forming domain family [Lachnospiraceae bacterium NE2001]|nr:Phenylacetate-coenzyme A ligase PaaK, adenylate-forming domain family [Lachnospiraceae bacterium NE2001]